jgi:acetyl esterase/lipase
VILVPEFTEAPNCIHDLDAIKDISYTTTGNLAHKFDLYRPAVNPAPVVIWIHGGGWANGDKSNIQQVKRLVCAGYAVASINYRLSGEAVFPAQIQDIKAAIRYIKLNASTLNVKGTRIATFGSSAGGHLAALAATARVVPEFEDTTLGNSGVSSSVQAAISWYGPTKFDEMDSQLQLQGCSTGGSNHNDATSAESRVLGCEAGLLDPTCAEQITSANPISYVGTFVPPPMYILHGDQDCTVPMGQSQLLKEAIDSVNRCAIRRVVQGASHGNRGTFPWTSQPARTAASLSASRCFS